MISCRDIAEQASAYMDRDLPPWSRLQVRLHLFVCLDCRRYLEQLRATVALVSRSLRDGAVMPPGNEEQLLAAVRARATGPAAPGSDG